MFNHFGRRPSINHVYLMHTKLRSATRAAEIADGRIVETPDDTFWSVLGFVEAGRTLQIHLTRFEIQK